MSYLRSHRLVLRDAIPYSDQQSAMMKPCVQTTLNMLEGVMTQDCWVTGSSLALTSCGAGSEPGLEVDSVARLLGGLGQPSVLQFIHL